MNDTILLSIVGVALTLSQGFLFYVLHDIRARLMRIESKMMNGADWA